MQNEMLVTVCIITYNHASYIRKALHSVLSQKTNFPFNIVVADDCSTDGTGDIVEEFSRLYPEKIYVLDHSRKYGIVENYLRLLAAPQSKYIAYLEGDDYWTDSCKLQKQIDFLENNPDYSGCQHETRIIDEKEVTLKETLWDNPLPQKVEQQDALYSFNLGHTNSWVFRTSCIKNLPEAIRERPYDRLIAYWVTGFGNWYTIPQVMSVYRIHHGGVYGLQSKEVQIKQLLEIHEVISVLLKKNPQKTHRVKNKLTHLYKDIAQIYLDQGKFKNAWPYVWNCFKNASTLKTRIKYAVNLMKWGADKLAHKIL